MQTRDMEDMVGLTATLQVWLDVVEFRAGDQPMANTQSVCLGCVADIGRDWIPFTCVAATNAGPSI